MRNDCNCNSSPCECLPDSNPCKNCGLCCEHLIIEIDHVDVVREPSLLPVVQLLDGGGRIEYETEFEKVYGLACGSSKPCPMLGKSKRCSIYPTRPNVCVAFEAGSDQCNDLREMKGLEPVKGKK